ncbi:MAG: glycosyltransferase family 87 protein [Armatimonadota bacterium]|nr:glycosyltransferase family 87 protein [Armatimonadota bacterium]
MRWYYTGVYSPSRLPGYLPVEGLNTLLFPLGWLGVNLLNTLIFGVAVILFAHILRYYQLQGRWLAWLVFVLLPEWVVENCSITEHTLSISSLIASWYLLLRNKYGWAGACMGLAMAARISQTPIVLPVFVLWLWHQVRSWRAVALFLLTALAVVAGAWFLPTWYLVGNLSFLQVGRWQGTLVERILGVGYDLQRAFSLQAMAVMALGILLNLDRLVVHLKQHRFSPFVWNTLLVFALIVYTPNKVGYALLMTPFLIPLLTVARRAGMFYWSSGALLSFWLVAVPYVSVYEGKPVIHLATVGKIAQELRFRRESLLLAQRLAENSPAHSVVFAGHAHLLSYYLQQRHFTQGAPAPIFKHGHIHLPERDVWLIQFPDPLWIGVGSADGKASVQFLEQLVQQRSRVYYLPQMRHVYSRYPHLLERARP